MPRSPILTPPASPPSPTTSLYDLSDDDEQEYNTIMHSSSGRGVKLLFSKSKVYVHPTPSAKDNIPGFIALIQQKPSSPPLSPAPERPATAASNRSLHASSYLLAWLPEHSLGDALDSYVKVEACEADSPPKRTTLVPPPPTALAGGATPGTYAFAVPVRDIFSLLVRPPSLGWWYGSVVISPRGTGAGAGAGLPALFFHDDECRSTILQKKRAIRESFDPFGETSATFWGGDEVLRWLKRYVHVERSGADANVYLVEPSDDDRLGFSAPNSPDAAAAGPSHAGSSRAAGITGGSGAAAAGPDAGMDPLTRTIKQARWSLLEKMAQVTTFARRTATAAAENPGVPPQVRRLMRNPEVQTLQREFDSARVYLARWAQGLAEQSERDRQRRIWTARDVLEREESAVGEFEILDAGSLTLGDKRRAVALPEWRGWFDGAGRLQVTPAEVKERVFHGGLDPSDGVRKEAWLFLLGVFDWDSTAEERKAVLNSKRDEFIRLKGAWWERMVDGHPSPEAAEWWKEQKGRIEKDVHRTDRHIPLFEGEDIPHPDPDSPFADVGTNVHLEQMKDMLLTYNEYNTELGYVQGMSDLLAPLYAVMQDDAVAFWAFVQFMDRMERNFLRDQSGMRAQLVQLDQLVQLLDPQLYVHLQSADSTNFFFFFRMLLVWYKREFAWADVLRLWEGLWTDHLSRHFHLFVACAILETHRDVILAHLKHFDEVLKYVNELSNTIDLEATLVRAESLFRRFRRTVEAIDRQEHFPAPTVRQRRPGSSAGGQRSTPGAAASGADRPEGRTEEPDGARARARIVTPELRSLLSTKPEAREPPAVPELGGSGGVGGS